MDYPLLGVFGLLTIVAVAALAPRLGVATPLILVLVGLVGSLIPGVPAFDFAPELILAVVLPPILYSAAVNVPLIDFRRNLKAITSLSVLLVVVSALVTGFLFHWLLPELTLPAAIAIGAVISPPDAIAATSIGKRLGLPPRLVTMLQGESLVNDASALVLLRSAVAASAGVVALVDVIGDFAYAVATGLVIGLLVGYVTVWVRSRLNNVVLNTTISFAVPFLAFIPANEVNASGVLAVVVAGLVTGHRSAHHFSAQDRISERINWRTAQFVLENGVFLLMGFELKYLVDQVQDDHFSVVRAVGLGLLATVVLTVVRIAFVVPLTALLRRDGRLAAEDGRKVDSALRRLDRTQSPHGQSERGRRRTLTRKRADIDFLAAESLGWRGGAVLAWSGMRGVVTVAAAQSLPTTIPYRPQLILIAFTVAIVTLLVQGGTLPLLIRTLRISGSDAVADRAELAGLVREMSDVGLARLDSPALAQDNGVAFDAQVVERVRAESAMLNDSLSERSERPGRPAGPHEQHRALRLRVLQAERAALLDARATGSHSSRVLERAQRMLDLEESRIRAFDEGQAHL